MTDTDGAVYVGLMSGTSLDGISAAAVRIRRSDVVDHELLAFHHRAYSEIERERLSQAMREGSAQDYCALAFDLGEWLADAALGAIDTAGVSRAEVRAIASHGQTIWHAPRSSTWQIGESAVIAERTGIDVISDFRVRDVAAGGEGAPLVSMADALLYSNPAQPRLLQNIGGMANVTMVPAGSDPAGVIAFDTGPGVAVIDRIVRVLYSGMRYDDGGAIARMGSADAAVVDDLLRDDYFAAPPPKSTGRERFGDAYADSLVARCRTSGAANADIVATATLLTARSIASAYRKFTNGNAEVVVSGGGALNPTLLDMLRAETAPRSLVRFDELFYDPEAKEAVAFALLAHLHLEGAPGNVIGATGARGPRVLGKLTPA